MEQETFNQEILEKIKEQNIRPRARWHFLLKNYAIWASGLVALLVGACAFSVIVYLSNYSGFELGREMNKSWEEILLLTLPYFWLIFLAVFIFIFYYNLKHTKSGYRYPVWMVALLAVAGSVFLGGLLYAAGLGQEIDEVLGSQTKIYSTVMNPHIGFWSNPSEGRLLGLVLTAPDNGSFSLVDREQKEWQVVLDSQAGSDLVVFGQPVRLLGRQQDDGSFLAIRVLPMMPGRAYFKNLHHQTPPPPGAVNMMPPLMIQNAGPNF